MFWLKPANTFTKKPTKFFLLAAELQCPRSKRSELCCDAFIANATRVGIPALVGAA